MSAYTDEQERSIRVIRLVQDWLKSGLITQEQRDQMAPETLNLDVFEAMNQLDVAQRGLHERRAMRVVLEINPVVELPVRTQRDHGATRFEHPINFLNQTFGVVKMLDH